MTTAKGKEKEFLTYEKLFLILKTEGKEKELCKDTMAHFIDYRIGIRLYNTDIITIYSDDTYELKMLFPTVTALDIFNKYTPAKVLLKDLKFYVLRDVSKGASRSNLVPFFNGLTVDQLGNLFSVIA